MVKRNQNLKKLAGGYLFPEIEKRKRAYLATQKNARLINLGIGDTTLPIPEPISKAMADFAKGLGTFEGYEGYGSPEGNLKLREAISSVLYQNQIPKEDIFISDGCKPDFYRLQALFGNESKIAIQDPAYPVYADTSVIQGRTLEYSPDGKGYENIFYLPSLPENNFFPDLELALGADILALVSPNNPTGKTFNRNELESIVDFALQNQMIILYDAAYSFFISSSEYPKSIYEIENAKKVAIELNSFSKMCGFTGVRLGYTVVPDELLFEEGSSVKKDWQRIISTCFNGASNIAARGAMAALTKEGMSAMKKMTDYYLENAHILKAALGSLGFEVYGGENAPFLWVRRDPKEDSWNLFNEFLQRAEIIVTPGSGFGPSGQGFLRLSAFQEREEILSAIERLKLLYATV